MVAPASFTRAGLRDFGFHGFLSVRDLEARAADIPAVPGVYAYLRDSTDPPVFLERSPAGWFKRLDPTIGIDELRARWVSGCPVVVAWRPAKKGQSTKELERSLLDAFRLQWHQAPFANLR